MSVEVVKLVDGTELVAEVNKGPNVWTLSKVAVIQVGEDPNQPGRPVLGIAPGIPLSRDPIKTELNIDEKHVLYSYEPNAQLVSVHRQTFSSIITAANMPGLGQDLSGMMDKPLG